MKVGGSSHRRFTHLSSWCLAPSWPPTYDRYGFYETGKPFAAEPSNQIWGMMTLVGIGWETSSTGRLVGGATVIELRGMKSNATLIIEI